MGITVVGSLNFDLCTYTARVPDAGETFKANSFETHAGGKGLNQTISIAKLRDPTSNYKARIIGNVGNDSFGTQLINTLKVNDVDTSAVGILENVETGVATILIEKETGQNRILITAGANGYTKYNTTQLESLFPKKCQGKEMVVFQQEIPDPCSIMRWLKEERPNYEIVFNPSPFQALENDSDWSLVDILVLNEIEALQVIESTLPENKITYFKAEIAKDFIEGYKILCKHFQEHMLDRTHSATVIITLGSKGALAYSKEIENVLYVPAVKGVNVVDTTGAGDTYLGALLTQLHEGKTLQDAMKFSTKASSLTVQRNGAAESMPHFNDVSIN